RATFGQNGGLRQQQRTEEAESDILYMYHRAVPRLGRKFRGEMCNWREDVVIFLEHDPRDFDELLELIYEQVEPLSELWLECHLAYERIEASEDCDKDIQKVGDDFGLKIWNGFKDRVMTPFQRRKVVEWVRRGQGALPPSEREQFQELERAAAEDEM